MIQIPVRSALELMYAVRCSTTYKIDEWASAKLIDDAG